MIRPLTALALLLTLAAAPARAQAPTAQATLSATWAADRSALTITWSAPEAGCLFGHEPGSSVWTPLQSGQPCAPTGQTVLYPGGVDQDYAARDCRTLVLLATDGVTVLAQRQVSPLCTAKLPLIARPG